MNLYSSDHGRPFPCDRAEMGGIRGTLPSDAQLRLALEVACIGIYDWDLMGGRIAWTGEHERLFGLRPGEFAGDLEGFLAAVHPEDRRVVARRLDRARRRACDYRDEFRVLWPDGTVRWIASRGRFICDEGAQPVRMIGTVTDVTEARQADQERLARLESEQRARAEAEAAERRAELLSEASTLLASSLDHQMILERLAALVVPALADWCAVDLFDEQDRLVRVALSHSDPAKVALAWEIERRWPAVDTSVGIARVIRNGKASLMPEVPDALLTTVARDPEHLACLRSLGLCSTVCVPIAAHGRVFGSLTLATAESGRRYDRSDLTFAGELAHRAALAVDNARLFGEVQQHRERLRASEERYRLLVEGARDYALFLMDPAGRIVSWNMGAERLLGWEEAEIVGQHCRCLFAPEQAECGEPERELERARAIGRSLDERQHVRKDGGRFWASNLVTALYDETGQLRGYSKLLRDITLKRMAEEERIRLLERERRARALSEAARQEAEAANRMKDEFLATLSHELRTPLNPIIGFSQLLQRGTLDAAARVQALEAIERNARQQARLIEDILDVSRIIRGKLQLQVGPLRLSAVIRQAVETVQQAAQARDIHLAVAIVDDPPPLLGDESRLSQVLWNLLSNAVKFTPPGGRVCVSLVCDSSEASIRVEGTGIGIPPDFLPLIFERFRQVDGSTTRRQGGLGLGLAIVRHLVELHGGTVEAASEGEGRGAAFTVRLPLVQVAEQGSAPSSTFGAQQKRPG